MPKNHSKYILTTLDTIPSSVAKTGTLISEGKFVTGTGTKFKSEVLVGDWVFDEAQGEMSRIITIMDDEKMYIEDAFTVDLAGIPFISTAQSRMRELSIANRGGSNTTVDGEVFASLEVSTFGEEMMYKGAQRDFVDPVVVDGATSNITVQITY